MNEDNGKNHRYFGTYFDRDGVLRLSRWAEGIGWVVLTIYLLSWLFSIILFISQLADGLFFDKGMTFTGMFSLFKPYLLEPMPGVFYFFGLQAVSKTLLILLDMEDNSRRAARK
ncbi:MAG: hypothetical protein HXY42_07150 [Chloroflexi bacterium]|nr:hypothetical protein [Chloroflexota bacterium]